MTLILMNIYNVFVFNYHFVPWERYYRQRHKRRYKRKENYSVLLVPRCIKYKISQIQYVMP